METSLQGDGIITDWRIKQRLEPSVTGRTSTVTEAAKDGIDQERISNG